MCENMIKLKDKTVLLSASIMLMITFTGMFCNFIIHSVSMPLAIKEIMLYELISEYMINFGAAYCIIFVTAWVIYNANN